MATAELAVAMPVLLLVLILALGAMNSANHQLRCSEAAAAAARLVARGESSALVQEVVASSLPPDATLIVAVSAPGRGRATVTSSSRELGLVSIPGCRAQFEVTLEGGFGESPS